MNTITPNKKLLGSCLAIVLLAASTASSAFANEVAVAAPPPWPLFWLATVALLAATAVTAARVARSGWSARNDAVRVASAVAEQQVGVAVFDADERLRVATEAFASFYPALKGQLRRGAHYADLVRRHAELTDQSAHRLLLDAGSVRKHHRPVTRIVVSGGRQTLLSDHVAPNGDLVLLRLDLSGQHTIDREMRRRLRRLDDLCNAAFRWTWRTDRKGLLLDTQPSLPGAAASPLAPFIGKHLLEALADSDAEGLGTQLDARQAIELTPLRVTAGEKELRCSLAATPVSNERDEFDGFFGALHAGHETDPTKESAERDRSEHSRFAPNLLAAAAARSRG